MLSKIVLTQRLLELLLLGVHRLSTIKLFSIKNMLLIFLLLNILPTEVLKHSRKGKRLNTFEYRWSEDKTLCVIACLRNMLPGEISMQG